MAGSFTYSLQPGVGRNLGSPSAFACVGGFQDAAFYTVSEHFLIGESLPFLVILGGFLFELTSLCIFYLFKLSQGYIRRKPIQGFNLHVLHLVLSSFTML